MPAGALVAAVALSGLPSCASAKPAAGATTPKSADKAPAAATPAGKPGSPGKPDTAAKAPKPPTPSGPRIPCKEPAAKDADLKSGLDAYLQGKWADAATQLLAWTSKPGTADSADAARAYYCLAFAKHQAGDASASATWYTKALPLLEARLEHHPSLELYYYLQALYASQADTAHHLAIVGKALQVIDGNRLCANPDGDDLFREARLLQAAGRSDDAGETLRRAAAAYDAGHGSVTTYRALVEKELGDQTLPNEPAKAEAHYLMAAGLDPTIPGVVRGAGMAKLQQGDYSGAAAYWSANWRFERQDGNGLVYVIPVVGRVGDYRKKFGDKDAITDLGEYTDQALEEHAKSEAATVAAFEQAAAKLPGGKLDNDQQHARDVADYRMAQFLTEYAKRGNDVQEFALRNGLVTAIHHRSMPG